MLIVMLCIVGIVLGLTFNVFVLLPVTLAGILAYAFLSQEQGFSVAAVLIPAISLQGGYMIGLTGREMLAQFQARLGIAQSKRV